LMRDGVPGKAPGPLQKAQGALGYKV
jgi:hypothetical protein